ncbi:AAA family ATPase [Vibrio sp. 1-Bac 57]
MSQTLTEIAELLKASIKKVQLIYAFNGTGKTRLSRNFRLLIDPKVDPEMEGPTDFSNSKVLYYNAFTEDLFYWDNDLEEDKERQLNIQPNSFTNRLLTFLQNQGLDGQIVHRFQQYSNPNITPYFNTDFSKVFFSLESGGNDSLNNIKISKGEESSFVWSVFYSLLEQVISVRNILEVDDRETQEFNQLEYVFIDDPVSSLDDNHLIELAVNLAELIKLSDFTYGKGLKFIISTHNPLFYNVLHNELDLNKGNKKEGCYLLERFDDGLFNLNVKYGDSNRSFSYHLYLRQILEAAIAANNVEHYHFTLLRNLYEKTASFLGYQKWSELLPGDKTAYLNRIIQHTSHSSLSNEMISQLSAPEKKTVELLFNHLIANYGYWK